MAFNIFKIEYDWYEGEHEETLLGKDVEREEFEKDLIEARNFTKGLQGKEVQGDVVGKGYNVECLPEYYEQIIRFLVEKKGYIQCCFDENLEYTVSDDYDKKIILTKCEKEIKRVEF